MESQGSFVPNTTGILVCWHFAPARNQRKYFGILVCWFLAPARNQPKYFGIEQVVENCASENLFPLSGILWHPGGILWHPGILNGERLFSCGILVASWHPQRNRGFFVCKLVVFRGILVASWFPNGYRGFFVCKLVASCFLNSTVPLQHNSEAHTK